MPPLVFQTHPVKSAASSTAHHQSCFSHAHLAPSVSPAIGSIRAYPVSTNEFNFLCGKKIQQNSEAAKLHFPRYTPAYSLEAGAGGFLRTTPLNTIPTVLWMPPTSVLIFEQISPDFLCIHLRSIFVPLPHSKLIKEK